MANKSQQSPMQSENKNGPNTHNSVNKNKKRRGNDRRDPCNVEKAAEWDALNREAVFVIPLL